VGNWFPPFGQHGLQVNGRKIWLVYKMTGSAGALGRFGFANQIPSGVASLGGVSETARTGLRSEGFGPQVCQCSDFCWRLLTLTESDQVLGIIGIAFLVGIVNAFDLCPSPGFLARWWGSEDCRNAICPKRPAIFNGAVVVAVPHGRG